MIRAGDIARNHGNDGLVESSIEIVGLDYEDWSALGGSKVRVRKEHEHYLAAFTAHRKLPFQVIPSLQQRCGVVLAS